METINKIKDVVAKIPSIISPSLLLGVVVGYLGHDIIKLAISLITMVIG